MRLRMGLITSIATAGVLVASAVAADQGRGLDPGRLERLKKLVRADVEHGRIPGVVMMVARDGKLVMSDAIGQQDPAKGVPMRADSIFRIYSMTKPIVSVAAMILVEEGRLQLADPIAKHIPDLKDLKVGVEKAGGLAIVAAERQPTVHDLLRHTSGFTYGTMGKSPVKDLYTKNGVDRTDQDNAEFVRKLSTVPLMFQPGTTWEYSRSTDVLGHVVERVSGMALDRFLEERIFRPLGMKDTAFYVPAEKRSRLAEAFARDPDSGQAIDLVNVNDRPQFLSGGGGLVSTAGDYLRSRACY